MKILHINSYYSGSKFYKNLYDKQIKSGIDIDVFVPVPSTYKSDGFDYGEYTKICKNHNKYDRYIFHLKHNKIYNDIKKRYNIEDYSMVHAHSLFSNGYIAMKLKEEYGVPYIVAVRNTDVNVFFDKMIQLRKLGIQILENADKVIFISKPYKNHTISKFIPKEIKKDIDNKSVIIPNGVDDFWLKNKPNKKKHIEKNKIKLIYVGRVDSNKNIETTIKACKLLIGQGYEVSYKIVGQIKEEKYRGITDQYSFIEYMPHCNREELIQHYRQADIFVMPSKYETFGLVYLEAMSQGLPIIYTKGQGFDEWFKEGEIGYSVRYNSEKDVAYNIQNILYDYENISKKCTKKIYKFNWGKINNDTMNIYSC